MKGIETIAISENVEKKIKFLKIFSLYFSISIKTEMHEGKVSWKDKSALRLLKRRRLNVSAFNQTLRRPFHWECGLFANNADKGKIQQIPGIAAPENSRLSLLFLAYVR